MTQEPRPLNRFEVFVSEHAAPIFVVVALLIVLGAGAVYWVYQRSGEAQQQVEVLRPQVTRINRAVCDRESLEHEDRAARCAERIRIGLVNCKQVERCRAALLAAITYPPPARSTTPASEGGGAQNPSTAGQQPAPGKPGGGHKGGHGQGQKPGPKAPQAAPEAEPAPDSPDTEADTGSPAGPPTQGGEGSPGQGESNPPPAAGKGGIELETCVLVVCAEVGVGR